MMEANAASAKNCVVVFIHACDASFEMSLLFIEASHVSEWFPAFDRANPSVNLIEVQRLTRQKQQPGAAGRSAGACRAAA